MRKRKIIAICAIAAAIQPGCDVDFDPKGTFDRRLAVVLVLNAHETSQNLRLHATYDPPGFNPLENTNDPDLTGASVTLTGPSGTVTFRDSSIAHPDPERYGDSLKIFTAAPFTPVRGASYSLNVSVPGYPVASAVCSVPEAPYALMVANTVVLNQPGSFQTLDIFLNMNAPPQAKGFYPRFYIEYEVTTPTSRIERVEVPSRLFQTGSETRPIYPSLGLLDRATDIPFSLTTSFRFSSEAYRYSIEGIIKEYGSANVRFRRAIFYVYLANDPLYNYYNVVNGFRDEFSIRTDSPDITNITNAVGVFGSMSLDSLSFSLNSTLLQ